MGARKRLSTAARERLTIEAELYEQTCYFIMDFDPTKVLDVAYKNIDRVLRDLEAIISSRSYSASIADDVSSLIIKSRSNVENELIYVCDTAYNINTQQAFKEFLVHFKQGDLTKYRSKVNYSPYARVAINGNGGTKEKAPQLTKLERKQQNVDEQKRQVYLDKLNKESNDYHTTIRFILSFLRKEQVTNEEHRELLSNASSNIMDVELDLQNFIQSHDMSCDKDMSLIINGYRSKVENELQGICDNVSDLSIQQAYTQHLDDFRTGFKLSAQDHHSHLQNEDRKIRATKSKMSPKKKKMSRFRLRGKAGLGSCKTPPLTDPRMNDYRRAPRHDHSECCMKNRMETFGLESILVVNIDRGVKLPTLEMFSSDDDSS